VEWPTHDRSQANVLLLSSQVCGRKIDFIVDSGAEKSLLPSSIVPEDMRFPSSVQLVSAAGDVIPSFGHVCLPVSIRALRRDFKVDFILTDTKPILGADFLTAYGLNLDMKHRKLVDPLANIAAELLPSRSSRPQIFISSTQSADSFLTTNFPQLLSPPDYTMLPTSSSTFHRIETNCPPIHCRPRQLSLSKYETAKQEFDSLLAMHIIRPSSSPWSSPLHLVRKADGSWRPCGDYRRLNAATTPDRYALPNIQTVHHRLAGSTVFSRLDLVKAYHFVPMHPDDIQKTAICTPFGTFEYLRMPFGLRNSASSFQRYIDSIFRTSSNVVTYIDDILIFSKDHEEHERHLHEACKKLVDAGLKINQNKSLLFKTSINFLGFEINARGIKPMKDRINSLVELTPPTDHKQLQRYVGMFGFYQRCVPHFSNIVKPLRDLLNAKDWNWTSDHEHCFTELKHQLSTAVELTYPQRGADLTITCDASAHAIGACLHQMVDGESLPLSFFSKKLTGPEQRYSTFDRELLALFSAVRKWRDLISGCKVTAFTDHKPLVGAIKNPKPRSSDRQERQLCTINEYVSDIVHVAGRDNVVADALSRPQPESLIAHTESLSSQPSNETPIDLISIAKAQSSSTEDFSIYTPYTLESNLKLYCECSSPNPRPVVPLSLRKAIFDSLHELSHSGPKASTRLVGSRYYWPSLKTDVKKWSNTCMGCQESKVTRHTKRSLNHLPCPTDRFTNVHIDIVGPLQTEDQGKPRYLLTMIDAHTRWLEAFPLHDITAESICNAFVYQWVARFGPPLFLITDKGSQFCSEILINLNKILGIHQIRTSAYNPQANGMVERCHRTLKAALKARKGSWLRDLPFVLLGMRMYPDDGGNSAFSLVTGEQPMVPRVFTEALSDAALMKKLESVQFPLRLSRTRKVKEFLPKDLETCQFVWIRCDRVRKPLEAPYKGPYAVIKRGTVSFTIKVRGKEVNVAIERLKPARLSHDEEKSEIHQRSLIETPTAAQDDVREVPKATVTRSGRRVRFNLRDDFAYS